MNNSGFWDFTAFWEFFNPLGDENFKCPFCERKIENGEKVEVDKERSF